MEIPEIILSEFHTAVKNILSSGSQNTTSPQYEEKYHDFVYKVCSQLGDGKARVLHEQVVQIITQHLREQTQKLGVRFHLPDLLTTWQEYKTSMQIICRICDSLDWYKVYKTSLVHLQCYLFIDHFIMPYASIISTELDYLIWRSRSQSLHPEELALLINCNNFLQALSKDFKGTQHDAYHELFEKPLLQKIGQIYEQKNAQLRSSEQPVLLFLEQAHTCLQLELIAGANILGEVTVRQVIDVLFSQLIKPNTSAIAREQEGSVAECIKHEKTQDLKKIMNILSTFYFPDLEEMIIKQFKLELREVVTSSIKTAGLEPEESTCTSTHPCALNVTYFGSKSLPMAMPVQNTMLVNETNSTEALNTAFYNQITPEERRQSSQLVQQVHCLLEKTKSMCLEIGLKYDFKFELSDIFARFSPRLGRILAVYANEALRKQPRYQIKKLVIDKIADMVKSLNTRSKAVFEQEYQLLLACRYLARENRSIDEERKAIQHFQLASNDPEFFVQAKTLFRDLAISEQMNKELKAYLQKQHRAHMFGIDFQVTMLNSHVWPLNTADQVIIPRPAFTALDEFMCLYKMSFEHRVLKLAPEHGVAEIRAYFFNPKLHSARQAYSLVMSTYQMCVLMLFNDSEVLSLEEIQQSTNIPVTQLLQVLQTLLIGISGQALLVSSAPSIQPGTKFCVNDNFYLNRRYRLQVERVKCEQKTEEAAVTPEAVNQSDITSAVESAMQEQPHMTQAALIMKVFKQIKCQAPNCILHIWQVKNCISQLVQHGTLVQAPQNPKILLYRGHPR